MVRAGRGQPLGTQYQTATRVVPDFPLGGSASMTMTATGALTVVASVIVAASSTHEEHRFRSVQVPPLEDLQAVQRHLQRNLDEISRAVNPIRSIPDGGTGLSEVTSGALVAGSGSAAMQTVPIGAAGLVLKSDGAMPSWQPAQTISADRGDTNVTLVTGVDEPVQRFATVLTANRTVTLSATGAYAGATFRIVRTGLGAFTLNVGGLKTIPASTAAFVDVMYDGAAWRLTGYGVL